MLGPTPAEGFLAWVGLPDDYPHGDQLVTELNDELFTAAELVMAEWKRRDPLLRVLLHEDCALWRWVEMPAGDVQYGTRICMEHKSQSTGLARNCFGRVRRETPNELRFRLSDRPRIYVAWQDGDGGGNPGELVPHSVVSAYLPVPFDLGALLAEIDGRPLVVPPLTGRAPTVGQWSTINHAIRCNNGRVYRPRGAAGGHDRRPALRRRGWTDDTDMVTVEGRRVHAAYSYSAETGKLTERASA